MEMKHTSSGAVEKGVGLCCVSFGIPIARESGERVQKSHGQIRIRSVAQPSVHSY